jgi:hypothetical protein
MKHPLLRWMSSRIGHTVVERYQQICLALSCYYWLDGRSQCCHVSRLVLIFCEGNQPSPGCGEGCRDGWDEVVWVTVRTKGHIVGRSTLPHFRLTGFSISHSHPLGKISRHCLHCQRNAVSVFNFVTGSFSRRITHTWHCWRLLHSFLSTSAAFVLKIPRRRPSLYTLI